MLYKDRNQSKLIERALVNDRLNNRFLKNKSKPNLVSDDVLQLKNYEFKKAPISRIGDSGKLLLAINKNNQSEKYIVKHEYIDCACNEFMYSKLGQLLGCKFADVKFFNTLTPPLNSMFTTEDVVGIEYLELESENVKFNIIKDKCKNVEDYFRYLAISKLFFDDDSYEIVMDKNNYIYKIDNSSTFCISNYTLESIYIDFNKEINGININIEEFTKKQFNRQLEYYKSQNYINYEDSLLYVKTNYGMEYEKYFLEPFFALYHLDLNKMNPIINTLCYFYPNYVGDYYKKYIKITQDKVKDFLEKVKQD